MERKLFPLLAAGIVFSAVLGWHQATQAALCSKCRDMMFIDSEGKCKDCGAPTASGALQICPKCSAKRHQCEHCLAATTQKDEATAETKSVGSPPEGPNNGDAHGGDARDRTPPGWTAPVNNGNPAKPNETAAAQPTEPEISPLPPVAANKEMPTPWGVSPESKPPAELPPDPVAPVKLKPINPARPGLYTSDKWRYQLQITSPATQSEGRWGWLTYDGQKLPRGDVNDYYNTPWGPIYWVDVPQTVWGSHGWMPFPLAQNRRQGRALAAPASSLVAPPTQPGGIPARTLAPPKLSGAAAPTSPRIQTLEINKSHNGQLARVRVGNILVIRLPGNPATGYQWQAATTNTSTMRLTVRPQYSPPNSTTAQGAAVGTYTMTFQAVQPGSGALRFYYVRPGDPNRPRDTFVLAVNVSPTTATAAARPAAASRGDERW